jgi:hypothetical protein
MLAPRHLDLQVQRQDGVSPVPFDAHRLVCAGWVGRDRAALQAHIDELAHLGVAPPTRTPIYMTFSTYLLTTDEEIGVVSGKSSGEVEYVLFCRDGDVWVTVGSDHTDRDVETKSIPASKQMYAKVHAAACWPFTEVRDHWNSLILRCWTTSAGVRTLYQESALSAILPPEDLLAGLPDPPAPGEGVVVFSGTIATKGGLIYGDAYDLELEDPVRRRTIRTAYRVRVLPQHM